MLREIIVSCLQGSGKCADILAYAAQNALQRESVSFDKDGKEVKQ